MFLKSIEIFGFKSFADKSRIDFGEGISTIVGPNGCGKSNVVDAVRWVLGEQSSKGMRLEKMENVIFNGTDQRHPLNVAEVTLIFSNDENILPLEFAEVSVKRRIFRNSNSEYFINNSPVTLREIREMLADTGVGMTEYIVIEQGKVDQILESKPVERRAILEETAGIKKFRMRSLDGTRRREKVKENIEQAEQILYEVEKQHKTLKVQSEKALRYRALSDVVFSCEVTLECKKHWKLTEQLSVERKKAEELEEKQNKEKEVLEKLKSDNQEFQSIIKTREEEIIELQKRVSIIGAEKDGLKRMTELTDQNIKDIETEQVNIKSQLEAYKQRAKELEKEAGSFSKERDIQRKKNNELARTIKEYEKNKKDNIKKIEALQSSNILIQKKEEDVRKAFEEHQRELRTVVDRLAEELDKRILQAGYSVNEQHNLETHIHDLHKRIKQELTTIKKLLSISTESIPTNKIIPHIENLVTLSGEAGETFKKFKDAVPSFLNDFLANDGVLSRKHTIDKKIISLNAEQEQSRLTYLDNLKKIESLDEDNRKLLTKIHEMEIQISSLVQLIESTDREEKRLQQSQKELESQILVQQDRLEKSQSALKKWKEELSINETKLKELEKEEKNTVNSVEKLRKEIGLQHSTASSFQRKLDDSIQKIGDSNRNIQISREKIADIQTRISMISENFRDRYGEMINLYLDNEAYVRKSKKNTEEIKKELTETKQEMSHLGNVNLLAAEEFEKVDERYKFLTSQLEDLYASDKNLQEVIEKIEQESRIKMEQTFSEVKKHFKAIFTRMMGGGKADLALVDSDDILTAGLEIYAQPPEKKTQYISQLSGGERTLIALSLLFALHSVKPAPFCLLDELDAPLDDRNIDRFLDLLHSFKDVTQFVLISHNKRSIAQSRNIIGVTMEERGVSKFIGVKLEHEKK